MISKLIQKFKGMSENNRIVYANVVGAFLVKGGSLIVSLFTMPVYLRFFNNETALGLWFTVLSVLNWILNFDLGIGNGLRNNLARTIVEGEREETKKYLSSAYISIGALCITLTAVFVLVFDFVDWNRVFNIQTDVVSREAMLLAVKIVFVGIMLQLFLKLITSVLYALQKSSVNNFLNLISSVLILVAVLICPSGNNDRNMVAMAVIHVAAVCMPLLVATFIVFGGKTLRRCVPSIKMFRKKHAKDVLSLGGIFLFVQVVYMIIMSTNEYLITAFCANQDVVEYQIYHKLFSLGGTIFALAMTPIWSAVTKAIAEENFSWVQSLYKKLMLLAGAAAFAEFLIIPFLQFFVDIWLGDQTISIKIAYAVAFAVLGMLMIFNSVLSSIANGIGELRTQALFFGVGAVIKIPIAWLLVLKVDSWIGVVWANVIAMAVYCMIQPFVLKKKLKQA